MGVACDRDGRAENTALHLPPLQPHSAAREGAISVPAALPLCFQPGLARWVRTSPASYLVGQVCVDLILEPLLHVSVSGQVVGYVAEGGASGLITSKDKDKSLSQNLLIT